MPAAIRPYVTAGVALVGAGVISVTPIEPPSVTERISNDEYSLTAAATTVCGPGYAAEPLCGALGGPNTDLTTNAVLGSGPSLFYIPVNLFNAMLSIPAWEIQAMDRFADAMIATGSWQVWGPTNVFGFDEQDPPKLEAFVDMLMPFKPFSSALGEELSWWARANLPMNSGCAALPGACPNLGALLDSMFKVPMSQLYAGYQFPAAGEEGSTNPFTGEPVSWAGETPDLEPFGPFKSTWEYLTAPPTGIETVPLSDYFTVPLKLGKALFDSFYPFVQNSEWYNDDQTGLAPLFRALAPLLCPSCDPDNPYDNPWLYENYPPNQDAADEAAAESTDTSGLSLLAADPEIPANTESPTGGDELSETPDSVTAAVTNLKKKFGFADAAEEPAAETVTEVAEDVAETVADPIAVDPAEAAGESGEESTETEGSETVDADAASDEAEEASEEAAAPEKAGATGRHHKSDDDSNSVESIRDRVSSAASATDSGSTTDSGSSDKGSSDKGSSDKGSSDKSGGTSGE